MLKTLQEILVRTFRIDLIKKEKVDIFTSRGKYGTSNKL